jgi:hypothetical protein
MAVKIKIKRGLVANLPTLDTGELAYTTDTKKLYIGTAGGNEMLNAGGGTNADTLDGRHLYELDQYNMFRSAKDSNGIFTQIDYKRYDGTLFARSVLSGGTSPSYTTRTVTYYDTDGTTVLDTVVYTISYDGDGDVSSEVGS